MTQKLPQKKAERPNQTSLSLGLLQSWRIIDAVSSHCNDIAEALLAKGLVGLDTRFWGGAKQISGKPGR